MHCQNFITICTDHKLQYKLLNKFESRDFFQGDNAEYTVTFETIPKELKEAFQVVPESGYQEQEFKLVISDASLLDFDDKSFNGTSLDEITVEVIILNILIVSNE